MSNIKTALRMMAVMTVVTGIAYPLFITACAQLLFRDKANGSLVKLNGNVTGSTLIAQRFTTDKYFWPRPSAVDYNPMPSSGTNLGPTSSVLRDSVASRIAWLKETTDSVASIPPDLLFASGSGLDPHISPEAARYQVNRIIDARQLDPTQRTALLSLIDKYTEGPTFGILGQPRINVLRLNLALDSLRKM
jgi:potassium-transporting ATPase KdpC subunit